MKVMGLDYGEKRIGVALSDAGGTIAFPRTTLANDPKLIATLKDIIAGGGVDIIVVGDTRSYSGLANEITARAERFVKVLKKETALPVEAVFEAGSSVEAARLAPEGEHDDAAAAAVILQRYLDTKK